MFSTADTILSYWSQVRRPLKALPLYLVEKRISLEIIKMENWTILLWALLYIHHLFEF